MDSKVEYEKSVSIWKLEQENLISTLEVNIDYLEKEIVLKNRQLQLHKEALEHEKQFLSNYLKLQE